MKKTIKIIDLLNKIANGEEVPKKIKIREVDYKFTQISTRNLTFSDSGNNINYAYENDFENYWLDCARINELVEILDEEDEFEDIESFGVHYSWDYIDYKNIEELKKYVNKDFQNIFDTLDKLIKNQKKIISRLKDE